MRRLLSIALLFLALPLLADDTPQQGVIGPFGGLNTQDSPSVIAANQAQDMLNVDITPGGKSVKKRQGFGLDATFTTSSSSVHGTYKFFDANGNEVRLVGQDDGLRASVAGAAWVKVSSGTPYATWQCTDYLGKAYCVDSAHDTPVRTDGTVSGTSFQITVPAGTMVASTPDRLLIANTASNPSRIYYSGSTTFTDFTLGALTTSSSYEDITAPGSQITHVAYHYGRWLWWKDQSFGFILGTDQTNLQIVTVSDTIGTFDNTDVFWAGITYFRGTDGHFYAYDGAVLTPMTRDITPMVTSSNRRKSAGWTQTSQLDFQGGTMPSGSSVTFAASGDVIPSSYTATENTNTNQWSSGSANNTTVGSSSITLTFNNSGSINDNSLEGSAGTLPSTNWDCNSGSCWDSSVGGQTCFGGGGTLSPKDGTYFAWAKTGDVAVNGLTVGLLDTSNNTLDSKSLSISNTACLWVADSFTSAANIGKRVRLLFTATTSTGHTYKLRTVQSYIFGGTFNFYRNVINDGAGDVGAAIDLIQNGSSTITTGSFTSQTFNSGFSSATYQLQSSWAANTPNPTFALQVSSALTGPWSTLLTSTGTNAIGTRYSKYSSTITVGSTDSANTAITSISVLAVSSASYYSAVNNAPSLTSWGTLGITDTVNGASAIRYFSRASTNTFTLLSSTPAWVAQAKNATVTASTGTFFQLRADFSVTAATETPAISDFTFNWFEGNASDKIYGTYWDYGLWFAISSGTVSNNNIVLRYDLLNQFWTVYNIASNGFLTYNNSLYFGSSTAGKLYKFGGGLTSDDNAAISAYWKSKDFFGSSPFQDNDMRTLAWYAKANSTGTLSVTYQVNESTQTTYNLNLWDSTSNVIRNNRNFPAGLLARTINFKFGDNSTNPLWEVFAGAFTWVVKPWNATGP